MKIDDLELKKTTILQAIKQTFFHNYAILLDFDIFRNVYVIVQEIPKRRFLG